MACRHDIIRTNAGVLLIGTLGTNFSEILSEINAFSFTRMHWKMSSGKCRLFCLDLNVLNLYLMAWYKLVSSDLSPEMYEERWDCERLGLNLQQEYNKYDSLVPQIMN